MRIYPVVALLLATLAGCAAAPPPRAEVNAADFGPTPLTYRSDVREVLARKLFDPPTMQLRYGEPARAVVENGRSGGAGGGWAAGWVVPVGVKARRADGDYSGFVPRRFFFPTGGGVCEVHDGQRVVRAGPGG